MDVLLPNDSSLVLLNVYYRADIDRAVNAVASHPMSLARE